MVEVKCLVLSILFISSVYNTMFLSYYWVVYSFTAAINYKLIFPYGEVVPGGQTIILF